MLVKEVVDQSGPPSAVSKTELFPKCRDIQRTVSKSEKCPTILDGWYLIGGTTKRAGTECGVRVWKRSILSLIRFVRHRFRTRVYCMNDIIHQCLDVLVLSFP